MFVTGRCFLRCHASRLRFSPRFFERRTKRPVVIAAAAFALRKLLPQQQRNTAMLSVTSAYFYILHFAFFKTPLRRVQGDAEQWLHEKICHPAFGTVCASVGRV